MEAAGLRRPVRLRAPRNAQAVFAIVLLALACEPAPPTPTSLAVSPLPSVELDPTAESQSFRFEFRLGSRGLAVGDRVEIWLFPSREAPRSSRVTLNGGSIEGRLRASPVPRFSARADEPGGTAALAIEAISDIAGGQTIEVGIEVPKLPQQGYGLSGAAELEIPIRIVRAGGEATRHFDTARWKLRPEAAARLVLRLPSEVEPGGEATLVLGLFSKDGYPARAAREAIALELPAGAQWVVPPHAFDADDAGVQQARVRFASPGLYRLEASAGEFSATSNPIWVRKPQLGAPPHEGPLRVYWGDLHNHTRYSFDTRNRNLTALSIAESLDFARRASLLDFIAITDHGPNGQIDAGFGQPTPTDMPADDWARYSGELANAHVPGLVVFAGFEHLGVRGHTCLVFRDEGEYFVQEGRRLALPELWARYAPGSLLSIPHLHPLKGLPAFEPGSDHERLVEVVSKWGPYEFKGNPDPYEPRRRDDAEGAEPRSVYERGEKGPFVRDLLAAGKRYGFVGASDHGPPGQYGLTAVLASAATPEAIFDALLERRTWVTTGPRTWLDFRVGDAMPGEIRAPEVGDPLRAARDVALRVNAAEPIERIEILRNGEVWRSEAGDGRRDIEVSWRDEAPLSELASSRSFAGVPSAEYYVRVSLAEGEMAWGSPVYFELHDGSAQLSDAATPPTQAGDPALAPAAADAALAPAAAADTAEAAP